MSPNIAARKPGLGRWGMHAAWTRPCMHHQTYLPIDLGTWLGEWKPKWLGIAKRSDSYLEGQWKDSLLAVGCILKRLHLHQKTNAPTPGGGTCYYDTNCQELSETLRYLVGKERYLYYYRYMVGAAEMAVTRTYLHQIPPKQWRENRSHWKQWTTMETMR